MYEELNISDEPDKFINYLKLMTDDRQYNKYLIDNIYNGVILTSQDEIKKYCDNHRTCIKNLSHKRKYKKSYITTEKLWIYNIDFKYTNILYYYYENTVWLLRRCITIDIAIKSNSIAENFNDHVLIMKKDE